MARERFGELEEHVVLALLRRGGDYAVPVAEELATEAGRDVSPATVYMVMHRLAAQGLLKSRVGTPDPERGGRPRRFYRVVRSGVLPLLAEACRARLALWEGLEPELDRS